MLGVPFFMCGKAVKSMTIEVALLISILAVTCSIVSTVLNIKRNNAADSKKEATEMTTVIVKLETISNGVSEIKSDIRNIKTDVQELRDRVIIVEQSVKSAHHRLDGMEDGRKEG